MKHKVYKSILSMALALLISQPILAQSGTKTPPLPASPVKPRLAANPMDLDLRLELKLANLNKLEGHLAKLDHALAGLDLKIAPQIAAFEKEIAGAFENFTPQVEFNMADNFSHPDPEDAKNYVQAVEKTKSLNKSYSVDAKDKLAINNQYGKVAIYTWNKNEIKVDVEIKAYESSNDKAQDLIDRVSISESRQGDLISFKTNIDGKNVNWWSRTKNGKEERRGVQINYIVYMPSKNPLDLTNRYGSTSIADFNGPLNLNSSYGSLTAEKLDNPATQLKMSYMSANIESFSSGTLDVSYGSLKIQRADKLNAKIRYTSTKIGALGINGDLDLAYGELRIGTLDKNVRNLVINSSYTDLSMGLEGAPNFNFDVTVSYAGFNFNDDKVNITSKTPDENTRGYHPTKNWKGTYGKGSDSRVIIKSNYGGVKFL